jgi:hypothetical protein
LDEREESLYNVEALAEAGAAQRRTELVMTFASSAVKGAQP